METILICGLMLYGYTCILTMAVHIGRGGCTKETLKDSLCTFVLIPFFPYHITIIHAISLLL